MRIVVAHRALDGYIIAVSKMLTSVHVGIGFALVPCSTSLFRAVSQLKLKPLTNNSCKDWIF